MNNPDNHQEINIALLVEYDGTKFCGWQTQHNLTTVQEHLQKAIFEITNQNVKIYGCSRTDAGVHARGHVSNFHIKTNIPTFKLPLALNSKLPTAISVKKAAIVDLEFNARFDAKGKKYSYTIYNEPTRPALDRVTSCHVPKKLNVDAMLKAANLFLGEHDFQAFMASGSNTKTTIREITSIDIIDEYPILKLEITGNGFLYNMVRIIAGTLVYVGLEKFSSNSISDIINSKDRKKAGITLPANALCLEEVYYEENIFI